MILSICLSFSFRFSISSYYSLTFFSFIYHTFIFSFIPISFLFFLLFICFHSFFSSSSRIANNNQISFLILWSSCTFLRNMASHSLLPTQRKFLSPYCLSAGPILNPMPPCWAMKIGISNHSWLSKTNKVDEIGQLPLRKLLIDLRFLFFFIQEDITERPQRQSPAVSNYRRM